jgi:hypothetical protein
VPRLDARLHSVARTTTHVPNDACAVV